MSSEPLRCTFGEHALQLSAFDGKHFRLQSPVAFAPGQPLTLSVVLPAPLTVELKSTGSVRRSDGRFDVRARAATLRRETREALLAYFAARA